MTDNLGPQSNRLSVQARERLTDHFLMNPSGDPSLSFGYSFNSPQHTYSPIHIAPAHSLTEAPLGLGQAGVLIAQTVINAIEIGPDYPSTVRVNSENFANAVMNLGAQGVEMIRNLRDFGTVDAPPLVPPQFSAIAASLSSPQVLSVEEVRGMESASLIYVVAENRGVIISRSLLPEGRRVYHPQLSGGSDCYVAGVLIINNGEIVYSNNTSGFYPSSDPRLESMLNIALKHAGFSEGAGNFAQRDYNTARSHLGYRLVLDLQVYRQENVDPLLISKLHAIGLELEDP